MVEVLANEREHIVMHDMELCQTLTKVEHSVTVQLELCIFIGWLEIGNGIF